MKPLEGTVSSAVRFVLDRPLSSSSCTIGWILSTSLFGLLTRLAGGVTTSDSYVSVYSTLAIAHGNFSCAYPPQNTLGNNPLAPPLYPFISGALSAIFRIGHHVPFPSTAHMGPHCSNAFSAIGDWTVPTKALFSVVIIGYVGWVVLATGVVILLRATSRGSCGREVASLFAVACAPPVLMCLHQYFHPQDIIAVGLAMAAMACAFQQRWNFAGILLALAVSSQQFALLFAIPIIVVASRNERLRMAANFLVAIAVVDVPLLLVTSGRAFKAIFAGTGANTKSATLLVLSHLSGNMLYATSRILPIVLSGALALWARRRYGATAAEPLVVMSLVGASLTFRLIFEVNLWGYYFMAVTVVLIVIQVFRGQLYKSFIPWLAVVTYAAIDGGLANRLALAALPVSLWQFVLITWPLALFLGPLRTPSYFVSNSVEKSTKSCQHR